MSTPVLFLIYNRPDLTRAVFKAIRKARPIKLFIAADGPRSDRPKDERLCAEARAIVSDVDWPCEVQTLFRRDNIGCKLAVSSAITWFFEHVEEGIILEDDCLPHSCFFRYCGELLKQHRENPRVMMISGQSFWPPDDDRQRESYFFSKESLIWGWATWRKTWVRYDINMEMWPELRSTDWLGQAIPCREDAKAWFKVLNKAYNGEVDTWDIQWRYTIWRNDGLAVVPYRNMISNIGFSKNGTHHKKESPIANLAVREIQLPFRHPQKTEWNEEEDKIMRNHLRDMLHGQRAVRESKLSMIARVIEVIRKRII